MCDRSEEQYLRGDNRYIHCLDHEAPTGAVAGFVVIGVWSLFVGFVLGWLVGRW